jgi:hypothetical protein
MSAFLCSKALEVIIGIAGVVACMLLYNRYSSSTRKTISKNDRLNDSDGFVDIEKGVEDTKVPDTDATINDSESNDDSSLPALRTLRPNRKQCRIEGCENFIRSIGLCGRHGGGSHCSTEGCPNVANRAKVGLCITCLNNMAQ